MKRYYLQSGLWMSVLTVLIFGGLYVVADLNATNRPSNTLNIDGEFWSGPGFALDKISARSTKIALGPNANATVSIDLIPNGGAGNQMDDGVTSGTVSGQGTKIAVEVFAKGVTTALVGVKIEFDFKAEELKLDKVENSAFLFSIPEATGVNFAATAPVTLPSSGFIGRAEFSTVADVTGQEFTLGIKAVMLAETAASASSDVITTTDAIAFNATSSPDFDGDGTVGFSDFLAFAGQYGARQGDGQYEARYDLDGDGAISFSDFLAFASSYGTQVPPSGGGGGGSSGSPDLVVDSPSVSGNTLTTGQSFTLSATVRNEGTGASASTTLRYYQSSNATISRSDTEVGTDSVNGLSASGTSAESVSLNAPSSAGTYYYGACVESVSGESDTNNNCSDGVRVTVSSSTGGGSGGGGGGNTYGVGESLPNYPSGFFVPRRLSGASFSYSGGRAVLSFNNGGFMELQDGTTYTCIASGGCGVEGGRVTSGTIRVTTGSSSGGGSGGGSGSPDLIVESPSVSDSTLTTGQSFTLRATVRNSGTGSSASTTLRYYRSSNSTISRSDTEVGTDSVSGLSASGTSAESISLTAPSSAGTYYYGACVNSVTGESDTGNNCSSGVRVTVSSSTGGGGGTPPPSGNAVTGSITECSEVAGFIFISGTVRASRSVSNLVLRGYVGPSFVGRSNLGSLSAGQSKSFTITGTSLGVIGRCRVEMTWVEGGNKSQGVVDEQ